MHSNRYKRGKSKNAAQLERSLLSNRSVEAVAVPIDVAFVPESVASSLEQGSNNLSSLPVAKEVAAEGLEHTYRDMPFAVAFLLHLIIVLGVGIFVGIPAINARPSTKQSASNTVRMGLLLTPILVGISTAVPVSFASLYFIQRHAMAAIKCMIVIILLVEISLAIWFLTADLVPLGITMLLIFMSTAGYLEKAKNRLKFAAIHLEMACEAINANKMTTYVAFAAQMFQMIWIPLWVLGLFGIMADHAPSSNVGTFLATMTWLFFLYWFCYTMQNVAHCTTSGTVGSWWFTQHHANSVLGPLRRATSTSFGSIALGSMIVAFIQTVRTALIWFRIVDSNNKEDGNRKNTIIKVVIACAEDVLSYFERLGTYFNKYAFVIVSLYGKEFREAGTDIWGLFCSHGWTAIINDDLVEPVIYLTCLGIAAATALVGGIVAFAQSHGQVDSVYAPVTLSFFVGLLLSSTIVGVIDSATKTIFVCYAKSPNALYATHKMDFYKINSAWNQFHPETFRRCGYKQIAIAHGQPFMRIMSENVYSGAGSLTGVPKI